MTRRPRPTALLIDIAVLALASGVVELVRDARAAGVPVVLVGAAADAAGEFDAAAAEFDAAAAEFDAVADPTTIGASKPSRDFFAAACALAATPPPACLLVDAADRDVRGARAAGLRALRCTGPADLGYARAALGLPG